jgi:hypothetical protein
LILLSAGAFSRAIIRRLQHAVRHLRPLADVTSAPGRLPSFAREFLLFDIIHSKGISLNFLY